MDFLAASGVSDYTDLGVGGILIVLVLREVFGFVSRRHNGRRDSRDHEWRKVYDWTRELHEMHSVKDSDGIPIWYVRKSLTDSLDRIARKIDEQTTVMRTMMQSVHDAQAGSRHGQPGRRTGTDI